MSDFWYQNSVQEVIHLYHRKISPFKPNHNTVERCYNMVKYNKILHKYCRNWGRVSIRWLTHKTHPIPVFLSIFFSEKWPHYNSTAMYMYNLRLNQWANGPLINTFPWILFHYYHIWISPNQTVVNKMWQMYLLDNMLSLLVLLT